MNALNKIVITSLLFLILSSVSTSLKASDQDTVIPTVTKVAIGVFVASIIYDIATAPSSVRHYNENLMSMFPLKKPTQAELNLHTFGQQKFSRNVLISKLAQRRFYNFQNFSRKEKSPTKAFIWSLGATVIPILIGFRVIDAPGDAMPGVVIVSAGSLIGPSAGHIYAKNWHRGFLMTVGRFAVAAIGVSALYIAND